MWKVEKIVSKGDYNYAVVSNHPNATKHGYVLHHRIVIENHIDRLLNSNEVVHHINGNRKDNCIENLKLMSIEDHSTHHKIGKIMVKMQCPICEKIFHREKRQTHLSKGGTATCCSRSCGTTLGRMRQLDRITQTLEQAISGNILEIYKDNPEETT